MVLNYEELTNKRCPTCRGSGLQDAYLGLDSDLCETCGGTGTILVPLDETTEDL